jgi:osmoprotectant transport system permease protein
MSVGRIAIVTAVVVAAAVYLGFQRDERIKVGSKKFTESVILGEMITLLVENTGNTAYHRAELGGTRILWNALLSGDIDIYPEYTGTITQEILAGRRLDSDEQIRAAVAESGVRMTEPLGFNNTYAIGMKRELAARLGIEKVSDLRNHPELKFGFTNEFMDRGDGWPSLQKRYGLPQRNVRGLDHDIAYRALEGGNIEVMDLYSTDAEIKYHDLKVLEDDLRHFPLYNAVILYRADLEARAPNVAAAVRSLAGRISEARMIAMNARAKLDKTPEVLVAADFAAGELDLHAEVEIETAARRMLRLTGEHMNLVGKSMLAAILVAIPLGVWAAKRARIGQVVLGIVGVVQTIPALALLVALIRPLNLLGFEGIGDTPAIVALFLYSLLPIVRNTYAGLHDIPPGVRESAEALGLSWWARLRLIELPLSSRTILAGVKTAVVINVGFATLGALIAAGGYGQPILTGIRLDDYGLILQGAVPAAAMALSAQGLFELAERLVVPKGVRLKPAA